MKRTLVAVGAAVFGLALMTGTAGAGKPTPRPKPKPAVVVVKGSVTSIDAFAKTFVLQPAGAKEITVSVTEKTVYVGNAHLPLTFDSLVVGGKVEVRGPLTEQTDGSRTMTAGHIKIVSPTYRKVAISGKIASLDTKARTFVLQRAAKKAKPVTVTVTADTVIRGRGKAVLTFGDLVVGGNVQVKGVGTKTGDALSVTAKRIVVLTPKYENRTVAGVISDPIDATAQTFVLQPQSRAKVKPKPVTVQVASDTVIKSISVDMRLTFADIVAGKVAIAQGLLVKQLDGSLVLRAKTIEVGDFLGISP